MTVMVAILDIRRNHLAILNLHPAQYLQPSFRSIQLIVLEQITIEDFQDGCHDGYDSDGDVENMKSY